MVDCHTGPTSYPLDLGIRSRELRPTTHAFWWKAGSTHTATTRTGRAPPKAVENILQEAYVLGPCFVYTCRRLIDLSLTAGTRRAQTRWVRA